MVLVIRLPHLEQVRVSFVFRRDLGEIGCLPVLELGVVESVLRRRAEMFRGR